MGEKVLEVCHSLKDAIESLKERLNNTDKENNKHRKWYKENMPEKCKASMEEENWNDMLYLVYRNDYYNDKFYIFEDDFEVERWLDQKWSDWDLWDYDNPNTFLEENLIIWEFHRDICKEKWEILYRRSKPFIDGWSRKRKHASFEAVPSFSIG